MQEMCSRAGVLLLGSPPILRMGVVDPIQQRRQPVVGTFWKMLSGEMAWHAEVGNYRNRLMMCHKYIKIQVFDILID